MKYPELVDRYAELKYPERFQELDSELRNAIERAVGGRSEKQLKEDREALWTSYHAQFIREGALFSAGDILRWRDGTRRRSDGGKKMKKTEKAQELALRAFLEVDHERGTTAEAIERAWHAVTSEIPNPPNQKTIPEWLNAILFLTDIRKSPRGRPPKNPGS